MAKMSRARLLEALHYAGRFIAAGAEAMEKQRQFVQRLDETERGEDGARRNAVTSPLVGRSNDYSLSPTEAPPISTAWELAL